MIVFKRPSFAEQLMMFWPTYSKKKDQELEEAIRFLVDNPMEPCFFEGHYIQHGYGIGMPWDGDKAARNAHEVTEANIEIQRLRALLDPRRWTKETSDKWHRALPDVQAAFRAIRGD